MDQFIGLYNRIPETINPVFLQLGPVQIRYYGLMYLISFLVVYFLLLRRVKREELPYTRDHIDDYITWAILGVLIGARLGYALFYNLSYFAAHPLEVIWPVQVVDGKQFVGISGMSYHGGLIGAVLATYWFCKRNKLVFWKFVDFVIAVVPLGYMFGRIGNFLNGELYGRVTNAWWGMYFPYAPTYELRHPSQLYEAFFEGIVLFMVLSYLRKKSMFDGFLFWVYVLGYGLVRFVIEFYREPDSHIGFLFGLLSAGQILCLIMILISVIFIIIGNKTSKLTHN